VRPRKHLLGIDYHGVERLGRVHQIDGLRQSLEAEYVDSLYYSHLPRVCFGNSQRFQAKLARGERRGECTTDRAYASVKRQLAEEHALVQLLAEKVAHATDESQGHRKIESRSFFANVGRSEIDRNALAMRKLEAAIAERELDALTAFLDGIVREANELKSCMRAEPTSTRWASMP
jgi:hypothetical protein